MIGKGDFLQAPAWLDDYESCEQQISTIELILFQKKM